jgi:hypothetical protein
MLQLDLLPEELKKKRKKQFAMPEISIGSLPILIGSGVLLVAVHVILLTAINFNKSAHAKMTKEWQEIEPLKKTIELIRRKNIETSKNIDSIEKLMSRKVLWFRKLNQLSGLLTPGIWYTKLSIDEKVVALKAEPQPGQKMASALLTKRVVIPYLIIEGEVSATYGEELAIIGKFIKRLKHDKEFFGDFSNIELDSTKLHTILENDVMKFSINCYFKEAEPDGSG